MLSGLGAVLLLVLLDIGPADVFDRLAPRSPLVRRHGDAVLDGLWYPAFLLPPAVTVVVALLLS